MMNKAVSRGFSLVELLAVVAIASLLLALVAPSVSSLSEGMNVTRAGQTVGDVLVAARQHAITLNTGFEVRFLESPQKVDGRTVFDRVQLWRFDPYGESPKPFRNIESFSAPVVVALGNSPVLERSRFIGSINDRRLGNMPYRAIRFNANGRVEGGLPLKDSYLTVQSRNALEPPTRNYYTIQINPLTGRVTSYRP